MGEREWWQNVYARSGTCWTAARHISPELADRALLSSPARSKAPLLYRIHVRLKPEGAPKRYASPHDRWCWENNPKRAAALDELFAMDLPFERANEGGGE